MLFKIAWSNVRRAGRDYLVYFVTLAFAVMVFYAFNTISVQADFLSGDSRSIVQMLGGMLAGLTVFLAVVMGFLMVYANNFIMKRRKREFGLYQVLGMSRGQVSRVMAYETVIVSGVALVAGLALGLGLSWVMVFFTGAIFQTQIADFRFFVSPMATILTVGCLVMVFLLSLVFNLRVVRRSKVIDLMGARRANEGIKTRNAAVSAVVFVAGAALVGVAYARLLRDGLPIDGTDSGMQAFLVTTAMVCAGTLALFFGLAGFLLKALQAARGLYYRNLNMFTLRQLSAKVNTVSASMAVIAMVLFLAITSVTGGMSIASTMNESLEQHTPFDYSLGVTYYSPQMAEMLQMEGQGVAATEKPVDVRAAVEQAEVASDGTPLDMDFSTVADKTVQVDLYAPADPDEPVLTLMDVCDASGLGMPKGFNAGDPNSQGLTFMREGDYNRLMDYRGFDRIDLGEDGYLITSDMGSELIDRFDAAMASGMTVELGGRTLRPATEKVDADASTISDSTMGSNTGTVVVPDELIDQGDFCVYSSSLALDYRDSVSTEEGDAYVGQDYVYPALVNGQGEEIGFFSLGVTRTDMYASTAGMNGIISYLAIYIGFVLVVASAAILTIQQISGVSDAGRNYRILSELGTPTSSICRSVLLQQTIFFAFPLVVGLAHAAVALRVVIDLVALFGAMSIGGTVGLSVVIFAVAYGGYFFVTYLMSKAIVRDAVRVRKAV